MHEPLVAAPSAGCQLLASDRHEREIGPELAIKLLVAALADWVSVFVLAELLAAAGATPLLELLQFGGLRLHNRNGRR